MQLLAGGLAGGAAAAVTNPLDVVKTRLQTAGLSDPTKYGSGAVVSGAVRTGGHGRTGGGRSGRGGVGARVVPPRLASVDVTQRCHTSCVVVGATARARWRCAALQVSCTCTSRSFLYERIRK